MDRPPLLPLRAELSSSRTPQSVKRALSPSPPPLLPFDDLPRRVLCIAAHPDDEVLGCAGSLALHSARGDRLRVLVLSARSQPSEHEGRRAGETLGVLDYRLLSLAAGQLAGEPSLVEVLTREITDCAPELIYGPAPSELHPDRRATSSALIATLAGMKEARVLLYGVQQGVPANALIDVSPQKGLKRAALVRLECQNGQEQGARGSAAADDSSVQVAEGFVSLTGEQLARFEDRLDLLSTCVAPHGEQPSAHPHADWPAATAVISTWNKKDDVRDNLAALRAQTRPFARIVVVDNCSSDGTAQMIAEQFPEVNLTVMPNSAYGACETFNIGFASATTELLAILDDDVVLPPDWLEKATGRMLQEPASTAVVSTKIVEPGMPESYKSSPAINQERYMSTFRGCASLGRTEALREAGWYDERLFIYGNERDLTCRLLNRGYRILQYPEAQAFHKTPFGIKMGKRSLYFHARNAWLGMIKYAPAADLMRMPFLVVSKVLLRGGSREKAGEVSDATGTIGIGRSIKETPGAWLILFKAAMSVLYNLPYCLKRREPCRAEDFELPLE